MFQFILGRNVNDQQPTGGHSVPLALTPRKKLVGRRCGRGAPRGEGGRVGGHGNGGGAAGTVAPRLVEGPHEVEASGRWATAEARPGESSLPKDIASVDAALARRRMKVEVDMESLAGLFQDRLKEGGQFMPGDGGGKRKTRRLAQAMPRG